MKTDLTTLGQGIAAIPALIALIIELTITGAVCGANTASPRCD